MSSIRAPHSIETLASRRDIIAVATGAAALALASPEAQAQGTQHIHIFNPPSISKPTGFSHVAEVISGRTVYIAGQIGLEPSGKMAGDPGDFRAQAAQVFENLKAALAAIGGTFVDVVKLTVFFVDIPAHVAIFREVRDRYLSKDTPPTSTFVQIVRLARDNALVEVEAVAVLPPRA